MHIRLSALVVAAMFIFVLQCTESPNEPTVDLIDPLSVTPMANEEAELAALWLTGSLVAPVDLYERVRDDLILIRDQWGDSMVIWGDSVSDFGPENEIFDNELHFSMTRLAGYVSVYCHDTLLAKIQAGEVQTWNHLLDSLRADTVIVSSPGYLFEKNRISIGFEGRLHPHRLQEIFLDRVEGLSCCGLTFYILPPDYSIILPLPDGDEVKYVLRFAWSHCNAICQYADFYYFQIVGDSAELVDRWGFSYGCADPYCYSDSQPQWVSVAKSAYYQWQSSKKPEM